MDMVPAKAGKIKRTNCETIMAWFEGSIGDNELTNSNREYFERIKSCYRSQMNFEARSKTIKMLRKTYGISAATAQRLYADSEQIYGSQRKFNKEFKRHQAEEMAKAVYRKARKADSLKTMLGAVNAYIRATGVELEDSDIPAFDSLDPGEVIAVLPDNIREAISVMLQGGVVDLNQVEYTEFIDVTPADEEK